MVEIIATFFKSQILPHFHFSFLMFDFKHLHISPRGRGVQDQKLHQCFIVPWIHHNVYHTVGSLPMGLIWGRREILCCDSRLKEELSARCEEFLQKALELGMGGCSPATCRCSPWDTENPEAAVGKQNVSWGYFLLVIFRLPDTEELLKSSFCISQESACKEPFLVIGTLENSIEDFY